MSESSSSSNVKGDEISQLGAELQNTVRIKFARIHPNAVMPRFAHDGDSGFDLYTLERVVILGEDRMILPTGLRVELPSGYEIQIRPRSGISAKTPLTVLLGTVDSGYRGEIGVIVHNTSRRNWVIEKGERIAQGVVVKLPAIHLLEVEEIALSETSRGENGFGSTGR